MGVIPPLKTVFLTLLERQNIMAKQTKLTPEQKTFRKDILFAYNDAEGFEIATSECGRVTVAKIDEFPGSRMACFSVSIASPTEPRVKRKVGEYWALYRMKTGQTVILPGTISAADFAQSIADTPGFSEDEEFDDFHHSEW